MASNDRDLGSEKYIPSKFVDKMASRVSADHAPYAVYGYDNRPYYRQNITIHRGPRPPDVSLIDEGLDDLVNTMPIKSI